MQCTEFQFLARDRAGDPLDKRGIENVENGVVEVEVLQLLRRRNGRRAFNWHWHDSRKPRLTCCFALRA